MMRIALAQINPTVGDIAANCRRIAQEYGRACALGAEIVVFPEMAVLGYPPRDLLLKEHVVACCEEAVTRFAANVGRVPAIVGTPRRRDGRAGKGFRNSAAVCEQGRVKSWYDKRLLPTYDVFDEHRYFDPGSEPLVVEHSGHHFGLTICEDLWIDEAMLERRLYAEDTVADLLALGVDAIINIAASPFVVGKPTFRRQLFGRVAARANVPVIYVNQVGGNDELVFAGYSAVLGSDGAVIAQAAGFAEDLLLVDIPTTQRSAIQDDEMSDLFGALVLGVHDYVIKCGFRRVIVGLSGGIDSALVAVIATVALGSANVRGIGMPSRYSSPTSVDDARDLAVRLGIAFDVIPIEPAHVALQDMTRPYFDPGSDAIGVAEENIQARLRGNILMALSNSNGALLLTTGNKSELAVGYCTLYGDMAGGLAVISDVPKTTVYDLARWLNEHPDRVGADGPPIPESTLLKAPSAELRPNQTDQDTLPPYEILDEIVLRYVERSEGPHGIASETGFDPGVVRDICRTIDRNEYKRRQMPTGLKVTGRAFGSGWRMPIAARFGSFDPAAGYD